MFCVLYVSMSVRIYVPVAYMGAKYTDMLLLHALTLAVAVLALQQPIDLIRKEKVAIVGAGAGGSAAAYYLQKYTNHSYDITIFEARNRTGGRTTTVGVYGNSSLPIELGALIFVNANKIIKAAASQFQLKIDRYRSPTADVLDTVGIYDGHSVVFQFLDSWTLYAKLLWRYGWSVVKVRRLTQQFINTFLNDYYDTYYPFASLDVLARLSGFLAYTETTAKSYFKEASVNDLLVKEFIQAATRANYAQNTNHLHALSSFVTLAASGAMSISGGNWKVFSEFIKSSNATLKLATAVDYLEYDGRWLVQAGGRADYFDRVIIATPWTFANISGVEIPSTEYKELYVTLFTSNRKLSPTYFGLGKKEEVPSAILTTPASSKFYSVAIHKYIDDTGDYVYKVFSPREFTDDDIAELFDFGTTISWVRRKRWDAYPQMVPVSTFADFEVQDGLYYLNSMESFISCMETSALAGASVAALIAEGRNTTALTVP